MPASKEGVKVNPEHLNRPRKSKESVLRVCSHQSLGTSPPYGVRDQHGICVVKPFQQSCALLKTQSGCALLAERLPGQQRGGAGKEKQIHFLPGFCFLHVQLDSKRSPSQTRFELFKLCIILCCSFMTAQPATNLKVLSSLQTGRKPVVTG